MSLKAYRQKRHFRRTPEPQGKAGRRSGWSFVVQKHAASHLHYDFRLELDGVLKSWAVPKGPSLDPTAKRLAIAVEDHPLEYGKFEGVIPEGEYGGGTVMLWDRGVWEPVGNAREGYRQGKLKFKLFGEKLHGGWLLVRRHSSAPRSEKNWLLMKQRDEAARSSTEGDLLAQEPLSVSSGRDLPEIAAHKKKRVWQSGHGNGKAHAGKHAPRSGKAPVGERIVRPKARWGKPRRQPEKGQPAKLPTDVALQLATLTEKAPTGDDWLHEIKLDGYRMACRIDQGRVEFISRNHKNWTDHFRFLVPALQGLPARQAILDGEVVAMRPDGTTDFQLLQNAFGQGRTHNVVYVIFDVLYLDGKDLRDVPLEERKSILADMLPPARRGGRWRLSEHLVGQGPQFFQQACQAGVEGIISKQRLGRYVPGRGYDWLKVKCIQTGEFVIGGYTPPGGSRKGFGALLLGYYDDEQRLIYAGKVGTGFDQRSLQDVLARLAPLHQTTAPFSRKPAGSRGARWVRPELVAQIKFSNWTRDHLLRHPSFQGLREDKPAMAVKRERAVSIKTVSQAAGRPNADHPRASDKHPGQPNGAVYDAKKHEFQGVRLTSPDKLLYPEQGITKLELATYYATIADWVLPHVADRPLVLVRCPEGRGQECFFQKHPGVGTPPNLAQVEVREKSTLRHYLVVDDAEGLISLAQIGALEIHAWGSKADKLELPDRLVFDLDPDPTVEWKRVVESAHQVRAFLTDLGLESFVKTTGGKGLHLVVPIQRRHAWDIAKAFCKQVAGAIVSADPERYTANLSKAARHGKIFLDYLRNGRGATSVAPYSTRAKVGAPVSTPLAWEELTPEMRSDAFNLSNLPAILASLRKDPWKNMVSTRQSLSQKVLAKLNFQER